MYQVNKIKKSSSMNTKKVISRLAIKILRHQAVDLNLPIGEDGFIPINELIRYINSLEGKSVNLEIMLEIVNECKKQRFGLKEEGEQFYIRANQGHSMPHIIQNELLEELDKINLPEILYHGTYKKFVKQIMETGLSKMSRNNIHMVKQMPDTGVVISGMRKTCDMIVIIDAHRAYDGGIKFYISSNGVILSPGNSDGFIGFEYLEIRER